MLIPTHPDDERLSALASGDTDAAVDTSLTGHVSTCTRCTDLVNELGALRASLGELPDLRPSRPLRLIPPAEADASTVDRLGGWARRFFAPVLTAGAALALVGLVGTTAPAFRGEAVSQNVGSDLQVQASAAEPGAPAAAGEAGAAEASVDAAAGGEGLSGADALSPRESIAQRIGAAPSDERSPYGNGEPAPTTQLLAERSLWPMLLFTGVALMVAAALLRWILVPRAG